MKKMLYLLISLSLILLISISMYFVNISSSIDEQFCKKFNKKYDGYDWELLCDELVLIDTMNGIAIVQSGDNIIFALLDENNKLNSINSFSLESLYASGEKIDWSARETDTSNYILGIATNDAEQIIIQNPPNIVPNKININGIMVFYSVSSSSDEFLPVKIDILDSEGNRID